MSKPTADDIDRLVKSLGLPRYDFVVVADGSGTRADTPFGVHAAVLGYDDSTVTEVVMAATHGSNNHAELAIFVQAFSVIESRLKGRGAEDEKVHVHCVSDSEVTVKGAQGVYGRNANRHLWAALDYFAKEKGWVLTWRHIPRNSDPTHERADQVGRAARLAMEALVASFG